MPPPAVSHPAASQPAAGSPALTHAHDGTGAQPLPAEQRPAEHVGRHHPPALAIVASLTTSARAAAEEIRAVHVSVPLAEADVVVVVGGDGTLIDALHAVLALPADRPAPAIFGMHCGTVGFLLNDFSGSEDLLDRIATTEATSIRPLRMQAYDDEGRPLPAALACNEVVLRRLGEQAAKIRVSVDGTQRLEELRGDGVMVATEVGSTAYNYSAHGPILPVGAGLLALTPICAMRPRRWPGALLPHRAVVRFDVLEAEKRPVTASADQRGMTTVSAVEVSEATERTLRLLFDPRRPLDERVTQEQFHR